MGDGHDHLVAFDEVFVFKTVPCGRDFTDPRRGIEGFDLLQFAAHDAIELHPVGQNREILFDRGCQLFQLVTDFIATQGCQSMEPQIENGLHLPFRKTIGSAVFIVARFDGFDQRNVLRDVPDRPFLGQ